MNKIYYEIEQRKEILPHPTQKDIDLYRYIFFRHAAGFIISKHPKDWKTLHHPPTDQDILDHLTGKKWIGPRYQELTIFVILDLDHKKLDEGYEITSMIHATESNSMLCTSVSPGGFHLIQRVAPIDYPVSTDPVQTAYETYPKELICSFHPQPLLGIRGPFGKDQKCVYECHQNLITINDKLNCFLNLDITDLGKVPPYDLEISDMFPDLPEKKHRHLTPVSIDLSSRAKPHRDTFRYSEEEVEELIKKGLPGPGTRDHAQTILTISEYQQEHSEEEAIQSVWKFIQEHNKGQSNDYNDNPHAVFEHISGQVKRIYKHLNKFGILPEDIHCADREFFTEACFSFLLDNGTGDLPYVKFLTEAAVYSSSRQHRELLRVHCNLLRKWSSSRTDLKYIDKGEAQGILKRGSDYRHHKYPKYLMLNIPKMNPADAIPFNGRPARTFEEALVATRTRAEARQLLKDKGFTRKNAEKIVQRAFARNGDKSINPVLPQYS